MKLSRIVLRSSIAALLVVAAGPAARGQAPEFSLQRLGLTGGLFSSSTGVETSTIVALDGGVVAGTSMMTATVTTTPGGGGGGGGLVLGGGGGLVLGGGGGVLTGGGGSLTQVFIGAGFWLGNAATGVTTQVGLTGTGYTDANGILNGSMLGFRDGYAAGQSYRYSGSTGLGQASWMASAATGQTTRIGFYGGNYTATDGSELSQVQYVQGGYAAGYAAEQAPGSGFGQIAWVANGATGLTTQVGLYGTGYITDTGLQTSTVVGLNNGTVIGQSSRYAGDASFGQAGWVANGATGVTTQVGFTGGIFQSTSGTEMTVVQQINGGYVTGWSGTYNGDTSSGIAQWVAPASTGTAVRVGLLDAPYTSSEGVRISNGTALFANYVGGQSYLYSGGSIPTGDAAWVADAVTGQTRRLGFYDTAPYIKSDGRQESFVDRINETFITGVSFRYNGSASAGQAAWVATNAVGGARRIGLFASGSEYESSTGTQSTTISALKGGYVAGESFRFSGTTPLGRMAWVADATTGNTIALGLADATHTRTDGTRVSAITALTATGYVAGYSQRYDGTAFAGQTAWIYESITATFEPIVFSIRPADGSAQTNITRLFDSGLAIGQYELYDTEGNDLGARAFAWTPEDGAFELANVVPGGISAAGWSALTSALEGDPTLLTIVGYGTLTAAPGTQAVYAATPAPEPGTVSLLGLGVLGLAGRRRRVPMP